jgi:Short-chain dehydrogenase involved in D-alanine esterification of lipoteichoic acid and wall teichoic acid (D-alanine transfer protein)
LMDYIEEVMQILKASPDATEICVERVKPLRFAEASGNYDAVFKQRNDSARAQYQFVQ